MRKHQLNIKNSYKKLGKQYIDDISRLEPADLKRFIKSVSQKGIILDIGCAAGRDSAKFVKAGFNVVRIDLVEEFISLAKKRVPQGKFYVMDLADLKLPKNHFDGIWACAVLLHVEKKDILKVLKSISRVLKTGGLLNIRVKRGKDSKALIDKLSQGSGRNFTLFYKYELEEYVRKAGFKMIKSRMFPDEAKRKNVKWISISATK